MRTRGGRRGRRRRGGKRRGKRRRRRVRARRSEVREGVSVVEKAFGRLGEIRPPRHRWRRRGHRRVRRGERAAPSELVRRRNVAGKPTVHVVVAGGGDGSSRCSRRMWRLRVRTRVLAARARGFLPTGRRRVQDPSGRVDAVRGGLGRATLPAPHGARRSARRVDFRRFSRLTGRSNW